MLGPGFVYLAIVLSWVITRGNCGCSVTPPKQSDRLSGLLLSRSSDCSTGLGCPDEEFCRPSIIVGRCWCKKLCSKVLPQEGLPFNNDYCFISGHCGACGKACKVDPTDPTKCACEILPCSSVFTQAYGGTPLTENRCKIADGCNGYKCKVHPVKKFMCTCTKPCSQVHTLFAGSSTSITTEHCAKYGSCIGLEGPCYLPKGAKECMCANCKSCNPDIACQQGCEGCPGYKCECGAECTEPLSNCQAGCEGCSYYNNYCNCPQVCKPTPANCQPGCEQCPVHPCKCDHCSDTTYVTCHTDCEFCPIPPNVCCQSYCTTPPEGCMAGCQGCKGYYCGLNQPLNQHPKSYTNISTSVITY